MDYESRDVLMPDVRLFLPEKISDRKSTNDLGGEMPEFNKFADGGHGISWELLHAAWMCQLSIKAVASKIRFSEVAASTASPVSRAQEYTSSLL